MIYWLQIVIYAENARGRSKPLVIENQSVRDVPERRTERIIDGSLKVNSAAGTAVTPLASLHELALLHRVDISVV